MSIITLPDNNFRSASWKLVQPTQVNRSEFTSARQVMRLPGASYWAASTEHAPIRGEAAVRPWRAALAQLKGQAGTFRLIAVEGPQHDSTNPFAGPGGATTLASIANVAVMADSITRNSGGGAWDAGGRSTPGFGDGAALSFSPPATGDWHVGINTDPSASPGFEDIPYSWHGSSGMAYIRESGTVIGDGFAYGAGEQFGIVYSGGMIYYGRVNTIVRTVAAAAGQTFYLDSSLFTADLSVTRITMGLSVAGAVGMTIVGLTPGATLLTAGMLATIRLIDGSEQLVQITLDCTADSKGHGVIDFEPMLRKPPMPGCEVETIEPWAVMAMDDTPTLSVDPGAVYGFGFSATEAF